MSCSIDKWTENYIYTIQNQFHERIWFLGLQGSYGRGEATDSSDIDVVLILDTASADDLISYGKALDTLPNRDKICGFVSGKKELFAWEPLDLFQFYYDTTPILGSLDELLNNIHKEDIRRAIHLGACNIYHMCAHNMVHEKNMDTVKGLYKSAAFTLQAIAFLKTGCYEKKKTDLLHLLQGKDRMVLKASIELKKKYMFSIDELNHYSSLLLGWASKWICDI